MASTRYYSTYPASAMGRSNLTASSASAAPALSFQTPQTSVLSTSTFCYTSGSAGHKASNCDQSKRCYTCGEKGHYTRDCMKRGGGERDKLRYSQPKRRDTQNWKLGQDNNLPVKSIFENDYEDMKASMPTMRFDGANDGGRWAPEVNDWNDTPPKVQEPNYDLIDLDSNASNDSSDEYNPKKYLSSNTSTINETQLFSKVVQGHSIKLPEDLPLHLSEPSLIDDDDTRIEDEGKEHTVQVELHRKRKGKKGRSSTYDLTPFLSY